MFYVIPSQKIIKSGCNPINATHWGQPSFFWSLLMCYNQDRSQCRQNLGWSPIWQNWDCSDSRREGKAAVLASLSGVWSVLWVSKTPLWIPESNNSLLKPWNIIWYKCTYLKTDSPAHGTVKHRWEEDPNQLSVVTNFHIIQCVRKVAVHLGTRRSAESVCE